jgi:hypothetical protein
MKHYTEEERKEIKRLVSYSITLIFSLIVVMVVLGLQPLDRGEQDMFKRMPTRTETALVM